jgi:hypothetical protein
VVKLLATSRAVGNMVAEHCRQALLYVHSR